MYNENKNKFSLPAMIIRGETSKGIYLLEEDLPEDKGQWDSLPLSMMGSPDKKQIDGLGGAQSVTSKIAIVKKSSREDAGMDYIFAQASVDKDLVSYKGNCGNISSGVGSFTIGKGLIKTKEGTTPVRILNTNTNKVTIADAQTEKGSAVYDGDFAIAGVPGIAAPIKLKLIEPAGTLGNGLLPTGNMVDILEASNFGKVEVSIVDAANPLVFVKAKNMGMIGLELPEEVNVDADKLALLEIVRGFAAVMIGLTEDYTRSAREALGILKVTFATEAVDYVTAEGVSTSKENVDLFPRTMSMQKTHPSYAMTGAMCTIAAAVVPGNVVNQVLSGNVDTQFIRIGHPSGVLECDVNYEENGTESIVADTFGFRTVNLLMDGTAHIK